MQILMGWDSREQLAYEVAERSITRRSPAARVSRLSLGSVANILSRPIEWKDGRMWCPISQAPMSTEFAISRFCLPFITNERFALFVDCDIVCLADIAELFALADERYAVQVVKHSQKPIESTKMDGQVQTQYARKNWSSVVLWNMSHPAHKRLTLEALNTWPGRDLHAFKWLEDSEIGELPAEWNYLVGVSEEPPDHAKLLHYTLGHPGLQGWGGGPLDDVFVSEANQQKEDGTGTQPVFRLGVAGRGSLPAGIFQWPLG